MSPCAKDGKLHCVSCHTSSGRYRFKKENFNNACLPCHEERVNNVAAHSRHPAESEGSKCISCHMPKTEFARMVRSDHSMRDLKSKKLFSFLMFLFSLTETTGKEGAPIMTISAGG